MSIAQQGSTKNQTSTAIIFDSTPALGDLIIFCACSTALATMPTGTQTDTSGGAGQDVQIAQKIAGASETNSYTYSGISGTGAQMIAAVFRATRGFKLSGSFAVPECIPTPGTPTTPGLDPAGNPSAVPAILISGIKSSTSTTGATTAWNGGSANAANTVTGRSAFDFLVVNSIPADTKVIWSLGSFGALVAYTEAPASNNAGLLPVF